MYESLDLELLTLYNRGRQLCYSKHLEAKDDGIGYNLTLDECSGLKQLSLPSGQLPGGISTYFSGYMQDYGQFRVLVLGCERLNFKPGIVFDLTNFQHKNPLLKFKSRFGGNVSDPNETPFSLFLFYEKGYLSQPNFLTERYVIVKNCNGRVCYGATSNKLLVPDTGPEISQEVELVTLDCLILGFRRVDISQKAKNRSFGFQDTNENIYCIGLYRNKTTKPESEHLKIMKARLKGVDQSFSDVYQSAELSQGLLHAGFIEKSIQIVGSFEPETSNRFAYFVYNEKIKLCSLQASLYLSYNFSSKDLVENCRDYTNLKIGFNPEVEMIEEVEMFNNLYGFHLEDMPVRGSVPGFKMKLRSRTGYPDGGLVRYEVVKVFENLKPPKLNPRQGWLTTKFRSKIFEQVGGNLVTQETLFLSIFPIFGFLAEEATTQLLEDNSNRGLVQGSDTLIEANLTLNSSSGASNLSLNFERVTPDQNQFNFSFLDQRTTKKIVLDQWGFSTILFNRPIKCQGRVMKNIAHSMEEKYQISLQPLIPLYKDHFTTLPFRRENRTYSERRGSSGPPTRLSRPISKGSEAQETQETPSAFARIDESARSLKSGLGPKNSIFEDGGQNPFTYLFMTWNQRVSSIVYKNQERYLIEVDVPDLAVTVRPGQQRMSSYMILESPEDGPDPNPQKRNWIIFLSPLFLREGKGQVYVVREIQISKHGLYDLSRSVLSRQFGDRLDFPTFGCEEDDVRQWVGLYEDRCFLFIKPKKFSNNWRENQGEGGSAAGRRRRRLYQSAGGDNVTITVEDEENRKHSLSFLIEMNGIQSQQSLNLTQKLVIESKTNFTSFEFYDHFEVEGSWFDLDHSLSPNSTLLASADTVIHTFSELSFANYVTRSKYKTVNNSHITMFKAQIIQKNQTDLFNSIALYKSTTLSRFLTYSGAIKGLPQSPILSLANSILGRFFLAYQDENSTHLYASEIDSLQVFEFKLTELCTQNAHNLGLVKEIKMFEIYIEEFIKNKEMFHYLYLLIQSPQLDLIFYKLDQKDCFGEYDPEIVTDYEFEKIGSGVVCFDFISSYLLVDHYGYVVLMSDGSRFSAYGITRGYEGHSVGTVEVDLTGLNGKVGEMDYLRYVKIRHNQTDGRFDFIVDGDDQFLYVFPGVFEFSVDQKNRDKFNLTLDFDGQNGTERYVKPINMASIECDTTKDFLICASPVNYPEAFSTSQREYQTMLFVWARTNGGTRATDTPTGWKH